MPALNPNLTSFPGATPEQLSILNQVAGSNDYIAKALAGNPNASNPNVTNPLGTFNFWTDNPLPNDPLATTLFNLGSTVDSLLGNPISGKSTDSSGSTGFFSFIGDIQRVGTFLLGLILIAGGIFALSKGPLLEVGAGAIHKAATS